MKIPQFRQFQQSRPFAPFAIHIADARYFEIEHPDSISIDTEARVVTVLNIDGESEVVDAFHVTSLRPLIKVARKKK